MAPAITKKPKKKSAPDKPMPEWLFSDEKKNPVLNPKGKSEEQILKEKKERDQAVDSLQHRSVSAPLKPPPPALLLTLVGAFLTSYGFDSASRIYTTQLISRKELDDWKLEIGEKLPKGFPKLVKIFEDWYKDYQDGVYLDQRSSEDEYENPQSIKKEKKQVEKKGAVAMENSSSSSGSVDSSSDESEADLKSESASPAPKATKRAANSPSSSSPSSRSTSSSDSDADDEQEVLQRSQSASSSSSPSETSSSSDSDASSPPPHPSKTNERADQKATTKPPPKKSLEGTKKASKKTAETILPSKPPKISTKSSNSSATLEINSPQKPSKASASKTSSSVSSSVSSSDSTSDSSSSSSASPAQPYNSVVPLNPSKRKRSASPPAPQPAAKKPRTPFQRVPKDTKVDAKLASNAYVSHEYGDRAHQELSVTRGKGFTKEKNKKKRGSYRGGVIDVGGGKGIKFED